MLKEVVGDGGGGVGVRGGGGGVFFFINLALLCSEIPCISVCLHFKKREIPYFPDPSFFKLNLLQLIPLN